MRSADNGCHKNVLVYTQLWNKNVKTFVETVKKVCNTSDVILLQQHWLRSDEMNFLPRMVHTSHMVEFVSCGETTWVNIVKYKI